MKVMNVGTDKAVSMCNSALELARLNLENSKRLVEEAKEIWIAKKQASAWFGSSRERWEHAWLHSGDIVQPIWYARNDSLEFFYEHRINDIKTLKARIEDLQNKGVTSVVLEDREITLLRTN